MRGRPPERPRGCSSTPALTASPSALPAWLSPPSARRVTTARVLDILESVTKFDHLAIAAELLEEEHSLACKVEGTCIRLTEPVKGDPWRVVLRAIGLAQDAPAVGATATGTGASAAGVWRAPHLVAVRRTPKVRRVTLYKLMSMARPHDNARTESHIRAQYEVGNWYDDSITEEVEELLFDAGILLKEL